MSTLSDRSGQALLVTDVQAGVIDGGFERDRVVDNIGALVDTARAADVPIVWIQHNEPEMPVGSDWWQIVPDLTPRPDEARVDKQYRSSFEGTDLEQVLEALERGYEVTLVSDAHTTSDQPGDHGTVSSASIIDEQNAACSSYDLPGRRCELTTAATAGGPLAGRPVRLT